MSCSSSSMWCRSSPIRAARMPSAPGASAGCAEQLLHQALRRGGARRRRRRSPRPPWGPPRRWPGRPRPPRRWSAASAGRPARLSSSVICSGSTSSASSLLKNHSNVTWSFLISVTTLSIGTSFQRRRWRTPPTRARSPITLTRRGRTSPPGAAPRSAAAQLGVPVAATAPDISQELVVRRRRRPPERSSALRSRPEPANRQVNSSPTAVSRAREQAPQNGSVTDVMKPTSPAPSANR